MGTEEKVVEMAPETETDIRIKALEGEFLRAKNETRQLMLDIRALLMEAASPIRSQPQNENSSGQNQATKR
jgi:hypothetical protein